MQPDPIIVQSALAIPISLGLVIYTLIRWERAALHTLLAALLMSVTVWLAGSALKLAGGNESLRLFGFFLEFSAVVFMPPLFLVTMGYFARSPLFEQSLAPSIALFSVSAVFFVGLVTNAQHHLFVTDMAAALAGESPTVWAGPIYWASQVWTATADLVGFAYCGSVLVRGPSRAERGRAAMIFTAVLIPTLAHLVYMLGLLPVDYSLAPGTLGLTAIFFVQGVHRYGLLGGQTIVRHDLIELLDDGLLLTNEQGIVLDANAAAEASIGASRSEIRGLALVDALALLDGGEAAEQIGRRIVSLPLDGGRIDGEVETADGRTLEIVGTAVPAMASQPAGRFVSLQDRTRERRQERQLRERQKLESVGILAAGVAHEVNNPLAYVRANLVHLQDATTRLVKYAPPDELDDVAELPDVVSDSLEGIDRIARIVESMLRFSRLPDEQHGLVDLRDVVDQAIRLAALQRGSGVDAKWTADTTPHVLGSSDQLVQVMLNLFLNAKQAAGERGDALIEAEIRSDGGDFLIDVRDNGPGIPSELRERIFDPFFTTRGPGEGTGLGLSIAFDIVREHGGSLELSSRRGGGSCFSIRLPAAPSGATSEAA